MEAYSFFIVPIVLAVSMIPICGVCLFVILKSLKKKKEAGRAYIPFYIENGYFIINNVHLSKFLLTDISYVKLGVFKPIGGQYRMPGHSAYIRIVKVDGKVSLKYSFDSSVYTKRVSFFQLDSDLLESINMIEHELKAASIQYIVDGKEKLIKF